MPTPHSPESSPSTSPDAAPTVADRISRRGALVGGAAAVWAAPTITVLTTAPAFAASGALTVTATSPAPTTDAYVASTGSISGSGDPTQVFTATITRPGSGGTSTPAPVGTAVLFTLTGTDAAWLRLVDPDTGGSVTAVTALTDGAGRATVTVRYLATVVPTTTTATATLTATLPAGPTGSGTAAWAVTYRHASNGTTTARGAVALAAGRSGSTSLALRGGRAYGWGANPSGLLGTGAGSAQTPTRGNAGTLAGRTITAVDCFSTHSLFLAADNTVHAVGTGASGELGNGGTSTSSTPVQVDTTGTPMAGKTITAIAAGSVTSFALASDGTAYAWGAAANGRLGNGTSTPDQPKPVAVTMPTVTANGVSTPVVFTAIAAGNGFAVALSSTGTVYTWGSAAGGRLGNGANSGTVTVPTLIGGALAGVKIVAIATGSFHALALGADGTVYGWGTNNAKQVGTNPAVVTAPVALQGTGPTGATVIAIAAGASHSHAIVENTDGSTARLGWGIRVNGAQGDGLLAGSYAMPTAIIEPATSSLRTSSGTRRLIAIATGNGHTLALAADGTLHAWGANADGQLGIGNTTDQLVPVMVNALP